jgi:hypothetical protein
MDGSSRDLLLTSSCKDLWVLLLLQPRATRIHEWLGCTVVAAREHWLLQSDAASALPPPPLSLSLTLSPSLTMLMMHKTQDNMATISNEWIKNIHKGPA